MERKKMTD
jgi:hypothetical protein